jgi:hypothetical protein
MAFVLTNSEYDGHLDANGNTLKLPESVQQIGDRFGLPRPGGIYPPSPNPVKRYCIAVGHLNRKARQKQAQQAPSD